jgi:hypothetical protein
LGIKVVLLIWLVNCGNPLNFYYGKPESFSDIILYDAVVQHHEKQDGVQFARHQQSILA